MKLKRVLSLLMALVMTVSLLTLPVHAEGNDFASLTVAEQYAALKSVDNEADAQALFNTLTEQQQTALVTYAQTQADAEVTKEEYPIPAVNYTNVAPFLPPVSGGVRMLRAPLAAPRAAANFAANDTATDNGMEISKTATRNDDGSYTITLEAYATGEKVITEQKTDIPTDIILVLDQSGSMDYDIYSEAYPGNNHNGTYYVKSDGSYVEVTWCSRCGAWTDGCYNFFGHNKGEQYSPKTSAEDTEAGHVQFYSPVTRLDALKTAATNFANQVALKAKGKDGIVGTGDDVKHRIAVVGYAGSSSNLTNGFKQMINTSQAADVSSAINNLSADGGTHIDQGLSTANGIFASNPIGDTENRNRVVIVFTDGAPGSYGDWCSESVQTANDAIAYAKKAKNPTSEGGYGATVYTIGIFSGADASNPDSLPAYTSYTTGWFGSEQSPSNADQVMNSNRFMHLVSSNYPAASSITQPGSINPNLNGKSYYLSAADADSLNSIFQQISDQIETGGSSSTLTAESVIKDIISPQFTLPEGATAANITLETYKYKGTSFDAANAWEKNPNAMDATAFIGSTDESNPTTTHNQVSVTGFDFSENWCGSETNADGSTTYHGNKLVISFNVTPRPGFLGGNSVITNTNAGIYENATAENPVLTFEQPKVDVTIKEPTVTLPDANVYLGAYFHETVNAEDLKNGTTIKFGNDITLDLTKPDENWGLKDWQTAYVTIEVKVTDKDGNEVTEFDKLVNDTQYNVSVSIKPKTPKEGNNGYDESMSGTIHVFKPELTFADSIVYYGESVPENNDYSGNYVTNSEKWKNGDKYSTDEGVTMLGTKPTLDISYTPDITSIANGKINTKQDVPVKATVKIGSEDVTQYTTFLHEGCNSTCGWTEPTTKGDPAFLLHVKTCTLTVQKDGWDDKDANQSFIFNVTGGAINQEIKVTVQENGSAKITGLPVGSYTVSEDGKWSWRYTAVEDGNATLSAANPNATVTIENNRTYTKWLSGDNYAVNHVGGIKMPQGTFAGSN